MSNHTQRGAPATIDQQMDLLVTYFAKGYVKSGKIDDQAVAVALAREVIDKHTQRLVLEGKMNLLEELREHGGEISKPTKKGNEVEWYPGGLWLHMSQELAELQSQLDKLKEVS